MSYSYRIRALDNLALVINISITRKILSSAGAANISITR